MISESFHVCPLCSKASESERLTGADGRKFLFCTHCWLIFAEEPSRPSLEEERAHYQTHENSIENEGYVAFLRRVIDPLLPYLNPEMNCLDYGCGPGPTLSKILKTEGLSCEDYDPLFFRNPLTPPYNAVFSTECIEHFHRPGIAIGKLVGLLHDGGYLALMTETWTNRDLFNTWYYTRDPTHVSFFHERTMATFAEMLSLERLPSDDPRVFLFRKKTGEDSSATVRE